MIAAAFLLGLVLGATSVVFAVDLAERRRIRRAAIEYRYSLRRGTSPNRDRSRPGPVSGA